MSLPTWSIFAVPIAGAAVEAPVGPGPEVIVRLERGPCFGACPVYSVTVLGDRSATYIGRRYVAETGVRKGVLDEAAYRELWQAIEELGVLDMQDEYAVSATDMPTTWVSVIAPAGIKRIRHYGAGRDVRGELRGPDNAPEALWRFEQLVDRLSGAHAWAHGAG